MLEQAISNIDLYLSNKSNNRNDFLEKEAILILDHYNFSLYKFASDKEDHILIIPSIINDSKILYLDNKHNIITELNKKANIYLIKWKDINRDNIEYDFASYIKNILYIFSFIDKKLHLVGHCLGGNIAFGAAFFAQNIVKRLTLLSTPWDFSHFKPNLLYMSDINNILAEYEFAPAILIEIFFLLDSPINFIEKFSKYNNSRIFNKIESWLHSGNNLSKNIFHQIIHECIENNIMLNDRWKIDDVIINPREFYPQTLIINGLKDKIVPAESSKKLHNILPNSKIKILNSGHINYLIEVTELTELLS